MKLKLNIGQIFLTHPKDENFCGVFEESFSSRGTAVDLFAVVEVAGVGPAALRSRKADYEKLTRLIAHALKKTYISAPVIDSETFERALAAVNSSLARLSGREKISWFGHMNAVLAAVVDGELSLAATGSAIAYLARGASLSALSEGLADEKLKPTKIFSNYTAGTLTPADRVILGGREIMNYLAEGRVRDFLAGPALEEACEEIIAALSDTRDHAFGAYIFEVYSGDQPPEPADDSGLAIFKKLSEKQKSLRLPAHAQMANFFAISKYVILSGLSFLWRSGSSAVKFIIHFFKVLASRERSGRPKKYLFIAIFLVLVLFFGNLALATWRKTARQSKQQETSLLSEIDSKLNEAEAALIYGDENKTAVLISEAQGLLSDVRQDNPDKQKLTERLLSIKSKVSREINIDNPTVLASFESVPTSVIRSGNGFLAFNRNTGRVSFYDFRLGTSRALLAGQNTSDLALPIYLGTSYGYIFMNKSGKMQKLNVETSELSDLAAAVSGDVSLSDLARSQAMTALGDNAGARLYALDGKNNQIWRIRVNETDISAAEKWLKTSANFGEARDLAVDGSVYVLFADHADKYFNGQKQDWTLPALTPQLKNAARIYTRADLASIYILDPDNKRIVLVSKTGKLEKQFTSPKFRDLADIYVEEKSGIIHALAGAELLQINLK